MKRLAYFLIDTVRELPVDEEAKMKLRGIVCDGFASRDLDHAAHRIAFYMTPDVRKDFINSYYNMSSKTKDLKPEVEAALIAGVVSLGTAGIGYLTKAQLLKQCQRNMMFETGGGVWSTTSSQKIAGLMTDLLR